MELTEYRTLPKLFGKDTWFKTEETTETDETYSCVFIVDENGKYLYNDGCNILVIGCNPRGGDYAQEIADYEKARRANPELKHREKVGDKKLQDALEPFRRTPIYEVCGNNEKGIKKLIAWDMFVFRTQTADGLFTAMRSNSNDVNTFKKKICGVENFNRLQSLLKKENFDYIVFSWGDCWKGVANNVNIKECVNQYLKEIEEAITPYKDKCYCYGITSSGNPKHEQARGKNKLRKFIDQKEYDAIFEI